MKHIRKEAIRNTLPVEEYIGEKIGLLTIIAPSPNKIYPSGHKTRTVKCKCDCGNEKVVVLSKLLLKKGPNSCGCARGFTRRVHYDLLSNHKLHKVWANMKFRCHNPASPKYPNYGGRGIRVCDEWRYNFKAFYVWAITNGWVEGLQIDKDIIPKILGVEPKLYSPDYCMFVTCVVNARNRKGDKLRVAKSVIDGVLNNRVEVSST